MGVVILFCSVYVWLAHSPSIPGLRAEWVPFLESYKIATLRYDKTVLRFGMGNEAVSQEL
jgi:hypothetical protein